MLIDRVTGEVLPPEKQDKRGEAHIEPENWLRLLHGDSDEAKFMLVTPPAEVYDPVDARSTDLLLSTAPI